MSTTTITPAQNPSFSKSPKSSHPLSVTARRRTKAGGIAKSGFFAFSGSGSR